MGRLIEESRVVDILQQTWLSGTIAHRFIDDIKRRIRIEVPTVEAIPKDQYEAKLKADMVAILTEIQLEIQEVNTAPQFLTDDNVKDFREYVDAIIQQKIDNLKEKQE